MEGVEGQFRIRYADFIREQIEGRSRRGCQDVYEVYYQLLEKSFR